MELLGYNGNYVQLFEEGPAPSSEGMHHFPFPPAKDEGFSFYTSSPTFVVIIIY